MIKPRREKTYKGGQRRGEKWWQEGPRLDVGSGGAGSALHKPSKSNRGGREKLDREANDEIGGRPVNWTLG